MKELMLKCNRCDKSFVLDKDSLRFNCKAELCEKPISDKKREEIFLTYAKCSRCGRVFFLQIDNKETLELKKSLDVRYTKFFKLKKQNAKISKKDENNYKRDSKKLQNFRLNLMKENSGKDIYLFDEMGEYIGIFNLKFSIVD